MTIPPATKEYFNTADPVDPKLVMVRFSQTPPRQPVDAKLSLEAANAIENDLLTTDRARQYGYAAGKQVMEAVTDADEDLAEALMESIAKGFNELVAGEAKQEYFGLGYGEGMEDVLVEKEQGAIL